MAWAKIEIEFQPDMHDANDVMLMLANYFQQDGIPTAVVTLAGFAPDADSALYHSGPNMDHLADRIWALNRNQKITAIKELRAQTGLGLKESKDAIDAAAARNP